MYIKRIREEETTEQERDETRTDKLWECLVGRLKEGRMEDDVIRRLKDEDNLEKTRKKREEGARGSGATPTNEGDGVENTHRSRRYFTPSSLLTLDKAQIRPCLEYGSHL